MERTREFLRSCGLPSGDLYHLPGSQLRFPDGGQYRIEIPSTEGPRAFEAVVEEARARKVTVHRVSQGSGVMLLTEEEIRRMARLGAEQRIEVSLFIGPRAPFDIGAQYSASAGKTLGLNVRGADQLVYALEEVRRACALGMRSILVSDIGVLQMVGKMKAAGLLPAGLAIKTSVMMGLANPVSLRLLQDLGATSINIPSDLNLTQLAAIRAAVTVPLDFYIEAPDNLGGFIRYYELDEIVRICAPVYIKLGLRNSPDVYPSGAHLEPAVVAMARERVRRAQIALEMLARYYPQAVMSPPGAADLGVPVAGAAAAP